MTFLVNIIQINKVWKSNFKLSITALSLVNVQWFYIKQTHVFVTHFAESSNGLLVALFYGREFIQPLI